MKTLYLECKMGAAGDMLTAALLELLPDADAVIDELNALNIPGVQFVREISAKCGITGTHIAVRINGIEESQEQLPEHGHQHEHYEHEHWQEHHEHKHLHEHHHSSMPEIAHMIADLRLSQSVKENVLAVYQLIAEAESHVHGIPVSQIHFHEVGTMDALADITAVCVLMERISPDEIIVSPIHVGSGQVKCAHGILPVPAPATAYILREVPIYSGNIEDELCTPTGAALLKHFATRFSNMPLMKVTAIGYGMGRKDLSMANCIRSMLGETPDTEKEFPAEQKISSYDTILELSCNIDDMTPEAVGFAIDRLLACGALDVYTIPIGMKKSRPGILLFVLCHEQDKAKMLSLIFRHTTTLGIRETVTNRHILNRNTIIHNTPYGSVREKIASGYGIMRSKFEYEDLAHIAIENDMSIEDVRKLIEAVKE